MTTSTITPRKTQETCTPDAAPSSDTWRKCITISAALVTSLLFTGCTDPYGNYGETTPGLDTPGTTTPAGSPEYQALAQEACELMNDSHATVKVVAASRNKSVSGLKAEVQTISRFQGANARFTSPSVLRVEVTCTLNTTSPDHPNLNNTKVLTDYYGYDLKQINNQDITLTSMTALINGKSGASVKEAGSVVTASYSDTQAWYVHMGQNGVSASQRSANNAQAMPITLDGGVMSNDKKKMERLVTVLKRLANLAKAS